METKGEQGVDESRKYSVFVSGFPYETKEKDIEEYFTACGTILFNL